jgi:hypothetical protein
MLLRGFPFLTCAARSLSLVQPGGKSFADLKEEEEKKKEEKKEEIAAVEKAPVLEEDDDFAEFAEADCAADEEGDSSQQWQEDWDTEEVDDSFCQMLRTELAAAK